MVTIFSVFGILTVLPFIEITLNVPKPDKTTFSPLESVLPTSFKKVSTASTAALLTSLGLVVIAAVVFLIIIVGACNVPGLDFIARGLGICPTSYEGQVSSSYEVLVPPNPPGITTEKEGPFSVGNGEEIEYTLRVTRDPSVAGVPPISQLSLFDVPLFEYQFVSATGRPTPGQDASGRTYYAWDLEANQSQSSPNNFIFTFRIKPIKQDFNAINTIYVSDVFKEVRYEEPQTDSGGDPENAGAGTTSTTSQVLACEARTSEDIWYGADCVPNSQTCSGKWSNQMSNTRDNVNDLANKGIIDRSKIVGTGYNFGDPKCTFNAARRGKIIRELEPNEKRALFYEDIAQCEGTPNSFGTQDGPIGPAGHFQMNASGVKGPLGNYGSLFKKFDPSDSEKGDIPWQRQIQNAIRNNNQDRSSGQDFFWWGVAYCLCYYPGYRNVPVCDDIRNSGRIRQPNATLNGAPLCSECTKTQGPKGLGG